MRFQQHWQVAHASATGKSHLASNQECQDYTCFLLMPRLSPDALVAAVSDGLGSAPNSATGARIAAQAACAQASHLLWQQRSKPVSPERFESTLYASLLHARAALEFNAAKSQIPLSSLATTLALLVHTEGVIAATQVGDGAAIISTQPNEYLALLKPQRGEYANETAALTSRRFIHQSQMAIVRPLSLIHI